jgi:hypothetical protein
MAVKSICGTILISSNPDALARFHSEENQFELVELRYEFQGGGV